MQATHAGPLAEHCHPLPVTLCCRTLPTMPAAVRSENQLQAALVRWARAHADPRARLIFHVPNGGARDGVSGGVMVALGARKGVPDLCLPVPVTVPCAGNGMARMVPGLWLELKHGDGSPSEAQTRWLRTLAANGYAVALAWTLEDAQAVVEDYLRTGGDTATRAALALIGAGATV